MIISRKRSLVVSIFVAICLVFGSIAVEPQVAHAKSKYVGTYKKLGPMNKSWGWGSGANEYIYEIKIKSIRSKKVKLKVACSWAYGNAFGFYDFGTKTITAKLKGRTAKFSWKSSEGSKGTGVIKLVSKNKIKIKMKTTKWMDRMCPNFNYKTFKRSKSPTLLY